MTLEASSITSLVEAWRALWNGEYGGVDALIDPDFRTHAAMLDGGDGSAVAGPKGIVGMVSQLRATIPDLVFEVQVGPIVQDDLLALRWSTEGTYGGGFPGAGAPIGTRVAFTGVDILRIRDGRFVEYWLNSDTLLLTQLQVQPS